MTTKTIKTIIAASALASLSAPAFAQAHDHAAMNHAGHGAAAAPATPATKGSAQAGAGAVVKVNGLICDFCVQALTRTFKSQAAVRDVTVDLDAKEVRLGFKPGASLDDAAIGRLIKASGYNVVSIIRSAA